MVRFFHCASVYRPSDRSVAVGVISSSARSEWARRTWTAASISSRSSSSLRAWPPLFDAGTRTGDCRTADTRLIAAGTRIPRDEMNQLAGEEPDDEACGGGHADPAAAARRRGHGGFAVSSGEAEHPGGMPDLRQAIQNPRALGLEAAVVEDGVGFGEGRVPEHVGFGGERGQGRRTRLTPLDVSQRLVIVAVFRRARRAAPVPSAVPLAHDCLDRSSFVSQHRSQLANRTEQMHADRCRTHAR